VKKAKKPAKASKEEIRQESWEEDDQKNKKEFAQEERRPQQERESWRRSPLLAICEEHQITRHDNRRDSSRCGEEENKGCYQKARNKNGWANNRWHLGRRTSRKHSHGAL
jgi:hypothetical protein